MAGAVRNSAASAAAAARSAPVSGPATSSDRDALGITRPGLLPARLVAGPAGGHDVRVIDVSGGPPGWLTAPGRPGRELAFELPVPALRAVARDAGGSIGIRAWSPDGAADDEPLPLLLVHDGPGATRWIRRSPGCSARRPRAPARALGRPMSAP